MAVVSYTIQGKDATGAATSAARSNLESLGVSAGSVNRSINTLVGGFAAFYIGGKIWEGFKYGIGVVDDFQQSVVKTAAMITSLQGGTDIAGDYQRAKQYAAGLNDVLMQIDARTTLNLSNLQTITEEMIKQGVVLDYTNKEQVEGFTRLANAAAVYSRNGADERQLRQEVSALLRGQVDQNSQLASMLQKTVNGPLQQQVDKWKASGTLVQELGAHLKGFGPAAEDLATSWSAVKSSLETSLSLVARAGFGAIVKDVVEWLGKANEYLKTHREEIGEKIKGAWETTKSVMSGVATVAKLIYDNFEPFAALFIAGTLLIGVSKVAAAFVSIKETLIAIRAVGIAGALIPALATPAAAAGGIAAGVGGVAAAGAGAGALALAGTAAAAIAIGGSIALGIDYAIQPLLKKWSGLTGAEANNKYATDRLNFFMNENANSSKNRAGSGGSPIPQLNLGDSPEALKQKIELQTKVLAAFKAGQEGMSAIAKDQSAVRLAILKANYDAERISATAYYTEEKENALEAAQQKFQSTAEYLNKEIELLNLLRSKKGEDSAEYQEELAKNKKAVTEMQSAQLNYAMIYIDSEAKITAANIKDIKTQNDKAAAIRAANEETAKTRDQLDALRGKDQEQIKAQSDLRAEINKTEELRGKIILAIAAGDTEIAAALKQQLACEQAIVDVLKQNAAMVAQQAEARDRQALNQVQIQDMLNKGLDEEAFWLQKTLDLRNMEVKVSQDQYDYEKLRTQALVDGNQVLVDKLDLEKQLTDETNRQAGYAIQDRQRIDANTEATRKQGDAAKMAADNYRSISDSINLANAGLFQMMNFTALLGQRTNFAMGAIGINEMRGAVGSQALGPVTTYPGYQYGAFAGLSGARASGGPVVPYGDYLVGEKGPEILRMGSRGGAVIPNDKIGGGSVNFYGDVNFTLPNINDKSTARDLAREAVPQILRMVKERLRAA